MPHDAHHFKGGCVIEFTPQSVEIVVVGRFRAVNLGCMSGSVIMGYSGANECWIALFLIIEFDVYLGHIRHSRQFTGVKD